MKEERTDNSGPSWVSDVGCQKKGDGAMARAGSDFSVPCEFQYPG